MSGGLLPVVGTLAPWRDPEIVGLRRRPMVAVAAPEERRLSLDGTWRFRLFDTPDAVTAEALTSPVDSDEWCDMPVPGNWTLHDQDDHPHYTNINMPFPGPPPALPQRNPTGVYRRSVRVPDEVGRDRLTVEIGGAESVHAVYASGRFVGYGTDSRLASSYDVTDHVRDGQLDLAVVVVRYSAQSYVEDQDGWWMAGLHRPVTLSWRPATALADLRVDADFDPATRRGSARVTAVVDAISFETGWRVEVEVRAPGGAAITTADAEVDVDSLRKYSFTNFAAQVPLDDLEVAPWSAESPTLYDLTARLLDPSGREVDHREVRTGFRRVEIRGTDLCVNGKRIWIHGVNRHDHHPDRGSAVTVEDMRADLEVMRRHNITAIRTSHYPNRPEFLDLCDELGFYVVDEADIESHAYNWHLCELDSYRTTWLERVARMVQRDRNHASVIMWSLGNESGFGVNHTAAAGWLRRADPSRPLHYEDAIRIEGWLDGGRTGTDVVCPMYPTPGEVEEYGRAVAEGRADRPFIMCEYSHAMGNANGSLADYWDIMHRWPGLQGGFIWEWKDHGIRVPTSSGERLAYGGMFGDEPHDANFIADGLVSSDLVPHPAMTEVAWVYRPVATSLTEDGIVVENRRAFTDLDDLYADWVAVDGKRVMSGRLDVPPVAPGTRRTVPVPDAAPFGDPTWALNVVWRRRLATWDSPRDHAVSWDELRAAPVPASSSSPSEATRDGVAGETASTGELQIWRAPVDNDGFKLMLERAEAEEMGSRTLARWLEAEVDTKPSAHVRHSAVVVSEEHIHDFIVSEESPPLPRVGVRHVFDEGDGFDKMRWFGRGPGENYPDRNRGSLLGVWEAPLDRLPYLVPQEFGLRTDTRWVELIDSRLGRIVRVESTGAPFHFSAIRQRAEQLHASSHEAELREGDVVLSLDAAHRGVGNGACGPEPEPQYEIAPGRYRLSYRITETVSE